MYIKNMEEEKCLPLPQLPLTVRILYMVEGIKGFGGGVSQRGKINKK